MPNIIDNDIQVGTTVTSFVSKTFTWSAGDVLTILSNGRDSADQVSSVTATGLTFANVTNSPQAISRTQTSVWEAVAGSSGSGTITVTYAVGTMDSAGCAFVQTDGDSVEAANGTTGSGTTPSVSVTTITNGATVMGIIGVGSVSPVITEGSGYTVLYPGATFTSGAGGTAQAAIVQYKDVATAGATTFDATFSLTGSWCAIAFSIKPRSTTTRRRIRAGII